MKKILHLGMMLLAANFIYSQAGDLDTSFGTGGKVITSINNGVDKAYGVKVQNDGKILVAGYTYSDTYGNDFFCVRYNNDGSLDSTFGNNGKMTYDLQVGSDDKAYSIDIQNDGKIILAGYSDDGSDKAGALIRINSDGSLDSTFGNAGKVFTNFVQPSNNSPGGDEFKVIKIHQITGKIVVAGTSSSSTDYSILIFARYTSNGILDTTFGTNGKITGFSNFEYSSAKLEIHDIAIKANGKITAIGWNSGSTSYLRYRYFVCRLNNNGTLDTTFNNDGYLQNYFGNNIFNDVYSKSYALLLNPDDSILFCGSYYYDLGLDFPHLNYYFGKINADGITQTIGGELDFLNTDDTPYDMEYDSTGKIVMAGSSINSTANTSTFAIARINPDFTIDSTFGTEGKVTTTFGTNTANEAFDMAIQSDDKIIAVGYTGNDIAIARYSGGNLSVPQNEYDDSILVFPNPTNSILNITSKQAIELQSISIYNTLGQLVVAVPNAKGVNKVDVSSLSTGNYFIKVVSDKGTSNTKFVKK